jgi:hypothetical protein
MFFFIFLTKPTSPKQMKKNTLLLLLLLSITLSFAQKREKIKGTKIVTVTQKEIGNFETLEVEDNLEIFLVKGEKSAIEIEADENLHSVINIGLNGTALRLTTAKEVSGFKKLSVKVTYTDNFKVVIAKHEASVTAVSDLDLANFTFKAFDYAKIFANVKTKSFTLMANDKSKIELNLKSDNATIELSKNAYLKALVTAPKFKLDLYQKSIALIEGDVAEFKLRVDNFSNFTGKNLTAKNAEIITEGHTVCAVNVVNQAVVEASGESEIHFYGDAKIELKKFAENTVIMKKSLK